MIENRRGNRGGVVFELRMTDRAAAPVRLVHNADQLSLVPDRAGSDRHQLCLLDIGIPLLFRQNVRMLLAQAPAYKGDRLPIAV